MRLVLLAVLLVQTAFAAPKKVAVFVALCDNATQGIIPVPAKIGDGDKPEAYLYWGCSDGFSGTLSGAFHEWIFKDGMMPLFGPIEDPVHGAALPVDIPGPQC